MPGKGCDPKTANPANVHQKGVQTAVQSFVQSFSQSDVQYLPQGQTMQIMGTSA